MTDETDWNGRYQEGDTPWDSGIRSRELARVLAERRIRPCRAAELGCGSGTNAIFLAQLGFEVTAFDVSPLALRQAREKAQQAGVCIEFVEADLCRLTGEFKPFDFIFDRGCYHVARKVDVAGFIEMLKQLSRPGTRYLVLTGNANEESDEGPPRLREEEIRADLEGAFDFQQVREIRFEDAGGVEGPLGWSCLLVRRDTDESSVSRDAESA